MKRVLPAAFSFLFLCFLFEILVRQNIISANLIPAPSQILKTIWDMKADFSQAFLETLQNVLIGLGLSIVVGNLIAFLFSLSDLLKRAILPFAIFFQTVPIIAVAPLLVIYFGFGAPTVIASSFIVSIFPIIANTLLGLESAEASKVELFRVYKASPLKMLLKLKLPSSYPYLYAGLKISAGLSIIGAIAGEFVSGGGLGALIDTARTQQRVDIVFGALLLLSVMGLIFIGALNLVNYLINLKRPFSIRS